MKNNKKFSSGILVLIIIAVAAVLLAVAQIVTTFASPSGFERKSKNKSVPRGNGKYVAELYIEGIIQDENDTYNQEWLLDTIDYLKNDSNNEGILLYIDSPGGAVYQADEVYLALKDYREQKPIWAYFGPLAASGGYYIACSAQKIGANRNTLTGSIGVIGARSIDMSTPMEKMGIKVTTITAGRNKNMLSFNTPVTPEQKKIMQTIADECYEQFVKIVANARDRKVETIKELADGRIYTASQALENGLIDKICSYDDFKKAYKEFLKNDKISFREVKYERDKKFYEDFLGFSTKFGGTNAEIEFLRELVSSDVQYPAFLYEGNKSF